MTEPKQPNRRCAPGTRRILELWVWTGIIGLCAPVPGQAQQAVGETPIDEIVVTSRKRTESFQEIPESLTVFTTEDITDAGVDQLSDIAGMTPNLYFSGDWSTSQSLMTIRGVTNNPNADVPVAYVVDGVVYGNSFLLSQELIDIEQVEVLRGPQGSLYGRNSIGGAIIVTTKTPTNEFEALARTKIAKGDHFEIEGIVSGPIVEDKLLYRVSAVYLDRDGLLDNVFVGEPVDFRESTALRGRLLYYPTDKLSLDFRTWLVDADHGGTFWRGRNVPPALTPLGIDNVIQDDFITFGETEVTDLAMKIDLDTAAGTLTSITSYQDMSLGRDVALDFIPLSIFEPSIDPENAEIFTQELRFTSPDEQRLRWIIGAFFQDQDRFRSVNVDVNVEPSLDPANKNIVRVAVIPSELNNQATALFGQFNYDLTERLELTFGLRWDEDDREEALAGVSDTFSDVQPKLTLAYRPNEDTTIYGTFSEGFRSGGFNQTDVFGRRFDSEELTNYELGFKTILGDSRWHVGGALYYIDYENQQFFVFSTESASQALINAEESEILGGELEISVTPTDGLDLYLAYSFADTEITEFGSFSAAEILVDSADVVGNNTLYTPEYTINFSGQYRIPIGAGDIDFVARLDVERRGKIFWGFDNVEFQEPITLTGLRLGLESERWRATAFGTNLSDEDYDVFCFIGRFIGNANGINPCAPGAPLDAGVEFTYRF